MHSGSGNSVTENYTHTFTQDVRDAAENLGNFSEPDGLGLIRGN